MAIGERRPAAAAALAAGPPDGGGDLAGDGDHEQLQITAACDPLAQGADPLVRHQAIAGGHTPTRRLTAHSRLVGVQVGRVVAGQRKCGRLGDPEGPARDSALHFILEPPTIAGEACRKPPHRVRRRRAWWSAGFSFPEGEPTVLSECVG